MRAIADRCGARFAAPEPGPAICRRPTMPAMPTDAAVKFIAETASQLALLPLEDALALEEQPNLPGTINEHPNWRRRYRNEAGDLLNAPRIRRTT